MIEGSLQNVPLADVFQIAVTSQKSGILSVANGNQQARIYFELGNIQAAHLVPGIHLGEILVRLDLLTTLEVQELLLQQQSRSDGIPLGLIAIECGLIEAEDLHRAVERQVVEVLSELLNWQDGHFVFSEQSLLLGAAHDHDIDAMGVLLQVARQISDFEDGSADPGAVYQRCGDPTKVDMPQGGWEVLGYVDGRRSARSVASEIDLSERQVLHLLYELETLEVIERSPFEIEDPLVLVMSPSSALIQLLRLTLQRAGFQIHVGGDDAAALEFAQHKHPRAIVVDDHGGAGWSFVRYVRRIPTLAHVPVIVLTENEGGGLFGRFRRPKASTLAKPFQELAFQQLITGLVGRSLT